MLYVRRKNAVLRAVVFVLTTTCPPALKGATSASNQSKRPSDFSQIILPFDSIRPYKYQYDHADNALIIELRNTNPRELTALDHYDENLVRRVLIKDLGGSGTEVKLVLRDRNVRTTVTEYTDPFRVAIDLYDSSFAETRDPDSGLPLSSAGETNSETKAAAASTTTSQDLAARNENQHSNQTAIASSGRKLLQESAPLFANPMDLSTAVSQSDTGIGHAWPEYPLYIYRLQTVAKTTEGSKDQKGAVDDASAAMKSSQAMADYAGRLYDAGHEHKAQIAYQQILHKDPDLFSRDPQALWKFAEVHFGQGNLTLAEGYHATLSQKHRSSVLSRFAALRMLDIAAIRAIRENRPDKLKALVAQLAALNALGSAELSTQISIRKSYWSSPAPTAYGLSAELPNINDEVRSALTSNLANVDSARTAFVASSLLMNDIVRADSVWNQTHGEFAASYFQKFSGKSTEPVREELKNKLQTKISSVIRELVIAGKFINAVKVYEGLPKPLQSIRKAPETAWNLGESYRNLGNNEVSTQHYETAASGSDGVDRLKAQFWLATTAFEAAAAIAASNGGATRTSQLRQKAASADEGMGATWDALRENEQKNIYIALKTPIEASISSPARLKTPPRIVLAMWTKGLPSRATTSTSNSPNDWTKNFSATSASARLISDLARRFEELGQTKDKRLSQQLLRSIKPNDMTDDREAKAIWASQLVSLAEDYRSTSEYLEAGRIYAFIGAESENWEGRAEALYKGGLLLYRAGRREEAIEALRKAKADGNNIFYANLATERLNQIETK